MKYIRDRPIYFRSV